MLELFLCSLVTIVPDYLLRRRFQGKRFGHEITFFTVWYELRWGLTLCAMLTISVVTVVFYYHPSAVSVVSSFRTVTILPQTSGRVTEVFVETNQQVEQGAPLFRMDDSSQQAAAETARRRIAEVDAALILAEAERASAAGTVAQSRAQYQQTVEELQRLETLRDSGSSAVRASEIERLQNQLNLRQGAVDAALAGEAAADARISELLPAQRASAEAALNQAQVEIDRMTVYAGVSGTVEQFTLRVGDYVSALLRPAGILVPTDAGRNRFQAGFNQLSSQVVRKGGVAEIMCLSKPFTVVPMVITEVQDVISSGQIRPSDRLADVQDSVRPGTITAFLEPVFAGQTDDIPPGSTCLANAYTTNHDLLDDPDIGWGRWIFLHVVDTVGVVHAAGLRIKSLLLPLNTLVLTGH